MKRFLFAAVLALLLMPSLQFAHADLIVGPSNDFWHRHASDIIYLKRSYIVESPGGTLDAVSEPGSSLATALLSNGDEVYIEHLYKHRGAYWGYVISRVVDGNDYRVDGWVPMDRLLVIYDHISFAEDNGKSFKPYTGDSAWLSGVDEVVLWAWPGSGLEVECYYPPDFASYSGFSSVYTDIEGRDWAFVPYRYDIENVWVCLSDPANHNISAFNPAPPPVPWSGQIGGGSSVLQDVILWVIISLIVAVVVVTAFLVIRLRKP